MITEEKMNQIYNAVVSDKPLTTKELTSYGLTSNDLRKLKEQGIIENIKRGEYQLTSIEGLYNYGLNSSAKGHPTLALFCFNKCIKLNPEHLPSYLQILYHHLKNKDYQKVYKVLDKLNEVKDFEIQNKNLYLLLLSFITELPNEYQEQVLSISEADLLFKDNNKTLENKIRRKIYEAKLSPAMHDLKVLSQVNSGKITLEITRELLRQALDAEQILSENLLQLAKKENYHEIEVILESKTKTTKYRLSSKYALLLSRIIQKILRTKEIPQALTSSSNTDDMFQAIDENNFALALKLNNEYLTKYHLDSNNLLSILLKKVNELISELEKKEAEKARNVKQEEIAVQTTTSNISFTDLLVELFHQNIEQFSKLLKQYLKQKGKEEYYYLIINLTKLSIFESDPSFLKPILILTEIEKDTYYFDVSIYIQEFYINISKNELPQAKIYLEIISRYYKTNPKLVYNLTKLLEREDLSRNILSTEGQVQNESVPSEEQLLDKTPTIDDEREFILNIFNEMKNNNATITILKEIPWDRRKKIHLVIKEISGLVSFSIGLEPKSIVLRNLSSEPERIVFKEVLDTLFSAYDTKQYQTVVDSGIKLLQNAHFNPIKYRSPVKLFNVLGLSYYNLNHIEEAIKYLTIVTELNKEQAEKNPSYDHTELISKLQYSPYTPINEDSEKTEVQENKTEIVKPATSEEPKTTSSVKIEVSTNTASFTVDAPKVEETVDMIKSEENNPVEEIKLTESHQNSQLTDPEIVRTPKTELLSESSLDITKIEEIAYYLSATKTSIPNAITEFNLTEEQVLLIKLVYARDYYIEGMMAEGDKFLKQVEKNRNRTRQVSNLLNEIKRDRLFYKSRIELKSKRRTIILK